MTYTQAKLIIRNQAAYSRAKVRAAAIYILGSVTADQEDIDLATYAI